MSTTLRALAALGAATFILAGCGDGTSELPAGADPHHPDRPIGTPVSKGAEPAANAPSPNEQAGKEAMERALKTGKG